MQLNALTAVSPVDGRYRRHTESLAQYFSEHALIKYRVRVEIEYFIALCDSGIKQLRDFPRDRFSEMRNIYLEFNSEDAQKAKDIEKITNHDVKAVEYLIKEKMDALGLDKWKEFIHFGLTSQDINNTATPLMMKEATANVYLPLLDQLIAELRRLSEEWADIALLARTHGQPASPTRMGKEIGVFVERLEAQKVQLLSVPFSAKFGGATGNFNAHHVAYSKTDWVGFGNQFVDKILGLKRSQLPLRLNITTTLPLGAMRSVGLIRLSWILTAICGPISPTIFLSRRLRKEKLVLRLCRIK
jgi:adenylosuccinate lyase